MGRVSRKIIGMGTLYNKECRVASDALTKSVQSLQTTRRELVRYMRSRDEMQTQGPAAAAAGVATTVVRPSRCYGCAVSFTGHCLTVLEHLAADSARGASCLRRALPSICWIIRLCWAVRRTARRRGVCCAN